MSSPLEDDLAWQLQAYKIPFRREVMLVKGRRYRWDFVIGDLAVECQGSTWKANTGHTSGSGIHRDADKGFEALKAGFRPLNLTGADIKSGTGILKIKSLLGAK